MAPARRALQNERANALRMARGNFERNEGAERKSAERKAREAKALERGGKAFGELPNGVVRFENGFVCLLSKRAVTWQVETDEGVVFRKVRREDFRNDAF
jgi:hypothetical protein